MLQSVELQTTPSPTASIVWLHGLGADGYDFVPVVKELEALGAPPARYLFPHAPMRPVTINGGMTMRAWYDILGTELTRREDEAGVRESQGLVEELIAREEQRGIARSRIVLAGFSQGGAIALQTGLRHPETLAGVMALSTYLPLADSFAAEASAANRATPVFMAHGSQDPVVPYSMGNQSREFLEQAGYDLEWHDYPMPHSVCLEEVADIGQWLVRVLA